MKKPILVLTLAGALAVGLVLWIVLQGQELADRTPTTTGTDTAAAETQAEELTPPAELTEPEPLGPELEAEGRDEVEEPAETVARTRDAEDASWLAGTVVLPPGTPADEGARVLSLEVEMRMRQLQSTNGPVAAAWSGGPHHRLLDWAEVEPDGTFRIAIPSDAEEAHLAVAGRYLYTQTTTRVPLPFVPGEEIRLPAELGAWITGRLVAPAGASEEQALLAGVEVELGPDVSGGFDAFQMSSNAVTHELEADAQGRFEFRGISPAIGVGVVARPTSLAATRQLGIRPEPGRHHEVRLDLAQGTRLAGRVIDETGAAVPGAEVTARFPGPLGESIGSLRSTETDESGDFALEHVATETIDVVASHEDYRDASQRVEAEQLRDGGRLLGIDLVMEAGATIAGRVIYPDGAVAPGAEVSLEPDLSQLGGMNAMSIDWRTRRQVETDAEGRFVMKGLGENQYTLRAENELEEGERAGMWRATLREVASGTIDAELVLEPLATLNGLVVDGAEEPIPTFRVTATLAGSRMMFGIGAQQERRPFSDQEDGSFELEGLDSGTWEVHVDAEGYSRSEVVEVELPQPEPETIVFRLLPAASVIGTVLNTAGQPVSGAQVSLHLDLAGRMEAMQAGGPPSTFTDAEGRFTMGDLDPGSISLVASLEGFAPSEPVATQVAAGEVSEGLVLTLRVGGTITGEVLDDEGEPWQGRMVIVQKTPDFSAQHMLATDAAGSFRVEHLEPGTWQVVATANFMTGEMEFGGGEGSMSDLLSDMKMDVAEVIDGEVTHVVLGALPADPVHLVGQVRHGDSPVSGAIVSILPEGERGMAGVRILVADDDGRFEVDLDGPGPHLVTAQITGDVGMQHSVEFLEDIPAQEEVKLVLEMPLGHISGTVIGADGDPVEDCRVSLGLEDGLAFGSVYGGQYSETQTDAEGRYDLPYLRPGTYAVAVGGLPLGGLLGGEAEGGRIMRGGLELDEGTHLDRVDFELEPEGKIVGKVLGSDGNPIRDAAVFVRDEEGRVMDRLSFVTTDAAGAFTYSGLAEGRYSVSAKHEGLVSAESALLRVAAEGEAEVSLALDDGAILLVSFADAESLQDYAGARIQVFDANGRDVAGLYSLNDMMEASRSFSAGEMRVGPVPAGEYTVVARTPDGRSARKPVTVRPGERKLKLRLR